MSPSVNHSWLVYHYTDDLRCCAPQCALTFIRPYDWRECGMPLTSLRPLPLGLSGTKYSTLWHWSPRAHTVIELAQIRYARQHKLQTSVEPGSYYNITECAFIYKRSVFQPNILRCRAEIVNALINFRSFSIFYIWSLKRYCNRKILSFSLEFHFHPNLSGFSWDAWDIKWALFPVITQYRKLERTVYFVYVLVGTVDTDLQKMEAEIFSIQ